MPVRPSGWYDDPTDDSLLRYWDGVIWTDHTAARRPAPAQDRLPEQSAGHPGSGVQDAQQYGTTPRTGNPADQLRRRDVRADRAAYARTLGTGGFYGSSDVQLAGWWRRVLAFVVDTLLVSLIVLPFTATRISALSPQLDTWTTAVRSAGTNGASLPTMPTELLTALTLISLVQTLVYVVLEVALVTRYGVTPGRLLAGIRVRPTQEDGRVPFASAFRRTVVKNAQNLLSGLPLISLVAWMFQVVDYLWPLRDARKQSLHDKLGATIVVRSRRGTSESRRAGTGG